MTFKIVILHLFGFNTMFPLNSRIPKVLRKLEKKLINPQSRTLCKQKHVSGLNPMPNKCVIIYDSVSEKVNLRRLFCWRFYFLYFFLSFFRIVFHLLLLYCPETFTAVYIINRVCNQTEIYKANVIGKKLLGLFFFLFMFHTNAVKIATFFFRRMFDWITIAVRPIFFLKHCFRFDCPSHFY